MEGSPRPQPVPPLEPVPPLHSVVHSLAFLTSWGHFWSQHPKLLAYQSHHRGLPPQRAWAMDNTISLPTSSPSLPKHLAGTFLIALSSPEVQHLLRQAGGDFTGA